MMRFRWLLLLVFLAPFFVAIDDSSVWDSNEAFYVQTPREMIERSDWIVPTFNGQPRLNKPPLSYWVVGVFYRWLGVDLFWERLLMAIFAAASVLVVYQLGAELVNPSAALLAAGILATTFRLQILSRRLFVDVLLLFCVLVAVQFAVRWIAGGRRTHAALAGVAFGLGFLAKGPIALLPIPWLFWYAYRRHNRWARFDPSALGLGLVCLLLVGGSWFLMLGLTEGWLPAYSFIVSENIARFSSAEFGPPRGALYYFSVFLVDFFPWSLFFLFSLAWWIRQVAKRELNRVHPVMTLMVGWVALWILFFSLSENKQEYYILPAYPGAAIFLGASLEQLRLPGLLRILPGVLLVAASLLLLAMAQALFGFKPEVWLIPAAGLAFLVATGLARWKAAAVSLCLALASAFWLLTAPLEEYRPVSRFAGEILQWEESTGRRAQAGYYGWAVPSLTFYLNRPILELFEPDEAAAALQTSGPLFLILECSEVSTLAEASERTLTVLDRRPRIATGMRSLAGAAGDLRLPEREDLTRTVCLVGWGVR